MLERAAIGYGVNAGALLVARAFAALATGAVPGLSVVANDDRPAPEPLGVAPESLAIVREGLARCLIDGTGRDLTFLRSIGVRGKTGPAGGEQRVGPARDSAGVAGDLGEEEDAASAVAAGSYAGTGAGAAVAGPIVEHFFKAVLRDPELRGYFR